ncbi:hypothetical protein ABEB36_009487 [Hypothenemus hampei]|uniref:DDE Tnp4 domain-containing protein n=1 Tax=Hypothenemus hampei TaxID=57062 RepID=A0ABD1EGL8_HYPHA
MTIPIIIVKGITHYSFKQYATLNVNLFIYIVDGHDLHMTPEYGRAREVFNVLEEDPLSLLLPKTYLLADCAYPLRKYLITPFKDTGRLTLQQRRFNAQLSSIRVIIEQTFGTLEGMFRRLKFLNILKLENAKYIIIATCVLHNISINDNIDYDINQNEDDDIAEVEIIREKMQDNGPDGIQLRNQIMNELFK